jgi:hypothetical protein
MAQLRGDGKKKFLREKLQEQLTSVRDSSPVVSLPESAVCTIDTIAQPETS